MKEVTAAREALATLKPHTGFGATAQPAAQAQEASEAAASASVDNSNVSFFNVLLLFYYNPYLPVNIFFFYSYKRRSVCQRR